MKTQELVLPAPFEAAAISAGTEYGKRQVCWTLKEPGELFRCKYEFAWVDVTEREPWRGEPLWLGAMRRGDGGRHSFTDRARAQLAEAVIPQVMRYGFERLWLETHRQKAASETFDRAISEAKAEAAWWQCKADIVSMHAEGLLDLKPVGRNIEQRELRVSTAPRYAGGDTRLAVAATAWASGEHVGWMTTSGELIPLGDGLDRARGWS